MKDIYKWLFGPRGRAAIATPVARISGPDIPLPPALAPFAAAIAATEMTILSAHRVDGRPPRATQSQLGGRPWWPLGKPYPTGRDGKPLFLLAQFDLSEAPPVAPIPERGLLQFFIGEGEFYGCNLDDLRSPTGFACIYHADPTGPQDTMCGPRSSSTNVGDALPLENPLTALPLILERARMTADTSDYRFDTLLPEIAANEALREAYFEWCQGPEGALSAIRLGGYPTFTQDDPRAFDAHRDIGEFTLLTIDTTHGIMWGDSGVAQFFIRPDDLAARDFSRVAYNWDCC